MTALGGCIGPAPLDRLRADCAAILGAQQIYGNGELNLRAAERAAFGICPHPVVPEDQSDRQPLLIDGHLLVADVRLDNRHELARSLGLNADLRAAADSEILLRAWLRWGETSLDRIVGDYAFAVYETGSHKLTLVRDCIGQRPLFFAQDGDAIGFSSMPSGLLALPQFRNGFNRGALALAAADIPLEGDSTYFQSIRRVIPGQIVTFNDRGTTSRRYWQPSLEELRLPRAEDYVEAYREVLDEGVGAQLRRLSGPIAAHLSSGLDSSAVAATAARLKQEGEQVIAFTAAPRSGFHEQQPRGRFADESEAAGRTAQMHGMQHEVVRSSGSSLSLVRHLVATSQQPSCNILNQDWFWSIERRARDTGAAILLTGEFGNSTLNAGGLRVLTEWVRKSEWASWWRQARRASARADVSWRGVLFNSFEPWLPGTVRRAFYRRFLDVEDRSRSSFLTEPSLRGLGDRIETGFLPSCPASFAEARLQALRRSDHGTLLKGSLARHGIDNRSPLGDRRIVEFSLRLPPEQLLDNGVSQPLARIALSDRIPSALLNSKARGYQSADWFEHLDPSEVRSMTDEIAESSTACELIDIGKIRRTLAQWPVAKMQRFSQYQQLSVDLPNAIATGFFILEAEKWMSAPSPAPINSGLS